MAHDPIFEERIALTLQTQGIKAEPKKMFGGVAFMVNGNMSVGITNKGDFMVRFDGSRHEELLKWPGAKPMTFGHKDMKGFLFVDANAVEGRAALDKWVKVSLAYIKTLPAKATKKPVKKAAGAKAAPPKARKTAKKK